MPTDRLAAAQTALRDAELDALLIGPSADLRYLVGYDAHAMERLTLLVLPAAGEPRLVLPELEVAAAEASGAPAVVTLVPWSETEDPIALVAGILEAAEATGQVAIADRLFTLFTLRLQAALPRTRWSAGGEVMRRLRVIKDPAELDALRAVGAAIDTVHAQVPDLLRPGRTEREVGRDIAELILADHDEVAFVIVGSGPNGASPHHALSDRVLEHGDAVVVDIGGVRAGYCSDSTRNYVVGEAPEGYLELHALLEAAQQAAVEAVAPGVPAAAVDAAARQVLADAGHGEHFIHRTGHGIGLEVHEHPYIVQTNDEPLAAGMAFSIEPGLYLPGRYGMRIEDIVLVTDEGAERVNLRPRTVLVAG
ncbi:MAG: M24 family metallopeptidase [Nitriliruptoraceae bacterium]